MKIQLKCMRGVGHCYQCFFTVTGTMLREFERNPSDCAVVINRYGLILGSLYPPSACRAASLLFAEKKKQQIFPFPRLICFTKFVAVLEKDTKNCQFYQDNPPWGSFFCLSEFFPCCLCQLSGAEAEQPGHSGVHPYKSAQSYSEPVSLSHTSVHVKNRKN